MSNDLREELENALQGTDLAPSSETAPPNESTVTPSSGDSGTPTADPVAVSTPNDAPAVDLNAMAEKPRDEAGRFAPKPAEGIQPGPKGNQPPAAAPESGLPTPEQSRPIDRPPQAWPVAEREHWAALPDAVKNRVMTRERQIQQVIQETTEARRFTEEVTKTITPYMAMIQSEGGTPVTAIASLFQTAGALRTAPPQQKAQLVAAMVKQFGIDINMLDSALAGQGPAADPIEERINQRVHQAIAPMQQRYEQMEQQQQYEMQQQRQVAVSTVEQFIASQPYGDVLRADMADMMDYATRRGMSMTLEQCYQRACEMHPQISQIMANERQKQNLQQSSQAAQAAKGRAISVSGAPSGGGMQQVQEGDDIRSAIEASLAQMTR